MTSGNAAQRTLALTESGLLPDSLLRAGIRRLLKARLDAVHAGDVELAAAGASAFVQAMDDAPVALLPERANEQHYEVPAAFFDEVLGEHRKYSCCYWEPGLETLDAAEEAALRITCARARLEDGQRILELGCGWGSLSLWMARHYPGATITAVSNSRSQREHIESQAAARGLCNLRVVTADMNDFATDEQFDRIVSIEMFEHMRNYRELYRRVHGWLRPGGLFFKHIFCHRSVPYEFVDNGPQDWMSRHFFAGGIMPSFELPLWFQDELRLEDRWSWNGQHYAKTANAWLQRMDARRHAVMPVLDRTYGSALASTWFVRWRIFFMACAELFDYDDGNEWFVAHYLFRRAEDTAA